jgi:hypothetical protein
MTGYIRTNSATDAFNQTTDRLDQQRRRRQAEDVDAAIRGGISEIYAGPPPTPAPAPTPPPANPGAPPPAAAPSPPSGGGLSVTVTPPPRAPAPATAPPRSTGFEPVIRRVAATPGGGGQALQLAVADRQRQDRETLRQEQEQRLAIQALGRGEMDVFDFYSKRTGLTLDPNLVQNAQSRRLFAVGSDTAYRFYRDAPDQAAKFVQAYIQTGGDITRAYAAAGAPARRPNITIRAVQDGHEQALALIDGQGNVRGYATDADGNRLRPAPTRAPGAGAAGGRPLDREVRRNMLIQAGIDEQTAAGIAAGIVPTPGQVLSIAQRVQSSVTKETEGVMNKPRFGTPDLQRAETERRLDDLVPNWRSILQGQGSGAPAGGAPAGPATPPAPTAPPPPPRTTADFGFGTGTGTAAPPALSVSIPGPDGRPVNGTFTGRFRQGQPLYATPDGRTFVIED